jgi:methanogenic corrinoid protein MtbC1
MAISRAAQYLAELRQAGMDPAELPRPTLTAKQAHSPAMLAERCLQAFIAFDERQAADVVRLAYGLYPLDQVLIDVLSPALVELGERWHRGELPIAVEHFAVQFSLRQISALVSAAAAPHRPGVIVAACAPHEYHEIGLLIVVAMLRWRGWDVRYLGPNLPLERLHESIAPIRPHLLLLSASLPAAAYGLAALPTMLKDWPAPRPRIVIGGQAVAAVAEQFEDFAICLDGLPQDMVAMVEALLTSARGDPAWLDEGKTIP